MNVKFVNAEVLKVAADEVLIVRLPANNEIDEDVENDFFVSLGAALEQIGLKERSLVIRADGVEFAVAKQ